MNQLEGEKKPKFHSLELNEVYRLLSSGKHGLSSTIANERIEKYGENVLPEKKKRSQLFNFIRQFNNFLIYILLLATAISFYLGSNIDAYLILAIIIINALIGFMQEYRAEKSIESLKKMIVLKANVYRDEKLEVIDAKKLVPGDVVLLKDGDKIPADARLILVNNLRTVESAITGESVPVQKNLKPVPLTTGIADQKNMVWMGTYVAAGEALALVASTGSNTIIGEIAQSLEAIDPSENASKKRTNKLAVQIGIIAIIAAVVIFCIGYFIYNYPFAEIFLFTLASLVSSIPEGLPAVIAIVLAIGAKRMAKNKAIIRSLPATETLGHTTVIATDKTGTLTQNTMNIEEIVLPDLSTVSVSGIGWEATGEFNRDYKVINPLEYDDLKQLLHVSALCNSATVIEKQEEGEYEIIGDPTEAALNILAQKAGLKKNSTPTALKILIDQPFNKDYRYRASIIELPNNSYELFVVGAPETILNLCSHFLSQAKLTPLSKKKLEQYHDYINRLTANGMRVLGLAYKSLINRETEINPDLATKLIFAGLVGMKDPARPEVAEAIKAAHNAGIRIIMKTGDHQGTALAIAKEINLIPEYTADDTPQVLTEQDLADMDELQFNNAIHTVNVLARMTPALKMRVVAQLQKDGEIVAMTGDGVNDAPALKKADIGIAMGIIGTDVAKEASKMVLADDNFATIIVAVREGRIVFRNIRLVTYFLLTTNLAEYIAIVSALLLGLELPLLPVHILWLNLITDGIVVLALAVEPDHGDSLSTPIKKGASIIEKDIIPYFLFIAIIMTAATLYIFTSYYDQGIEKARTGAFLMLAIAQLFNVINMRSLKDSVFKIGFFTNKYLAWAILLSLIPLFLIVYVPFLRELFRFEMLSFSEMLSIIALSFTVLIAGEGYKLVLKLWGRRKK